MKSGIVSLFVVILFLGGLNVLAQSQSDSGLRKIKDVIVYQDSLFYSAFPSVIKRPDG